jgi:hypothetical protein
MCTGERKNRVDLVGEVRVAWWLAVVDLTAIRGVRRNATKVFQLPSSFRGSDSGRVKALDCEMSPSRPAFTRVAAGVVGRLNRINCNHPKYIPAIATISKTISNDVTLKQEIIFSVSSLRHRIGYELLFVRELLAPTATRPGSRCPLQPSFQFAESRGNL